MKFRSEGFGGTLRPFTAADIPALVGLLTEMQGHYRVPCPPAETIAASLADIPPGNGIELALTTSGLAGLAAWSVQWPGPGLQRGLFLKELYVAEAQRGNGVGGALMQALGRLARAQGCARIDFTANAADPRLLEFYARFGANALTDRTFHRLSGAALARLGA